MPKKPKTVVKLQIAAGAATPAPPVGPALGQHGVNIKDFVDRFNEKTQNQRGDILPVEISIFDDRSFTFILKTPPAAELLKKAAKVKKGSGVPHKTRWARLRGFRWKRLPRKKCLILMPMIWNRLRRLSPDRLAVWA